LFSTATGYFRTRSGLVGRPGPPATAIVAAAATTRDREVRTSDRIMLISFDGVRLGGVVRAAA